MLSFFPRDVLDEILNLIESVSEGFLPTLLNEANIQVVCEKVEGNNDVISLRSNNFVLKLCIPKSIIARKFRIFYY